MAGMQNVAMKAGRPMQTGNQFFLSRKRNAGLEEPEQVRFGRHSCIIKIKNIFW